MEKGTYVTTEKSKRGDRSYCGDTLQIVAFSGNYVTLKRLVNHYGTDERNDRPITLDMREWPLVGLSDDHLRAVGIIPHVQTHKEEMDALDAEIELLTAKLKRLKNGKPRRRFCLFCVTT